MLPFGGLQDASVGQPVTHDGQKLLRVVNASTHDEAAIAVCVLALIRQQRAASEVMGDLGSDSQGDRCGLSGEPDIVLLVDVVLLLCVWDEVALFVHIQLIDARQL